MKANRLVREKDKEIKTITRKVRLLKEFDAEICEDGKLQKFIPKKIVKERVLWNKTKKYPGKMFCLVSLGQDFPFNIGIDSDWLMNAARTELIDENGAASWHRQLLSALPRLIREYLEWLPDDLTPEERANALDIFPEADWESTTGLEFINDDAFKEILREELANCNFILCSDGQLRSPLEVRDIPEEPGNMDGKAYETLTRDCFTVPVVDTKAISKDTIQYLDKLTDFLQYPKISEMKEEEIKSLWDKNNPDDYKHILDILTQITTHNQQDEEIPNQRGPKVLPDAKGSIWTNILGPQLAFWSLPIQNGVESPIYQALINSHPSLKDTIEVHKSLRKIKTGWANRTQPGYKWKEAARESSTPIMSKIRELSLPKDDTHVLAMFCYCLRIDKPDDITFLTSTSGPIEKENCVIGPPFANEKIRAMFPEQIFTYDGPKDRVKDKAKVNDFLKRAGAIFVQPVLLSKEMDEDKTKKFLHGKLPPPGKKNQTYDTLDWTWGIQLNRCKDMKVLSKYLSEPDEELIDAIEKAKPHLKITWKYGQGGPKNRSYSSLDCSWITDLRDVAWVSCADGKLRKPGEASIPPQGEEPVGKQAILTEETIRIYTDNGIRFGPNLPDDPEEALHFWKTQPASREAKRFSICVKKLKQENKISSDDLCSLVGEVLWVTTKSSAPLRRFIDLDNFDDWGGFLGKWNMIDSELQKTLRDIGFEPRLSIDESIARELVKNFSTSDPVNMDFYSWDCLRQANSIILEENPEDFEYGKFLRYDGNWSSDKQSAYIQFIEDNHRFQQVSSRIIRPEQLPNKIEGLGYISEKFKLIDNEVEIKDRVSLSNESEKNIQSLMESLNLPFEFEVTCYDGKNISVSLEGNEMRVPYLIQYAPYLTEVTFHLSSDSNRWSNKIASFLTNQIHASNSLKEAIRICLGAAHENQDFDDASKMLEGYGIDIHPRPSLVDQSDTGGYRNEDTESLSGPTKQRGTLNEPLEQPDIVTKEELDRGSKRTRRKNNPKDSDKGDKGRVYMKGKIPKDVARKRKETGDMAEKIVLEELKKEGWRPLSWNDEFNYERIGHDLVLKRDNEIRIVEVKGHKGNWKGYQSISESQLRMGLNYHGKEPKDHLGCKYTVWLYVVENVYGEFGIHQINWPEKDISAYFNRDDWVRDK